MGIGQGGNFDYLFNLGELSKVALFCSVFVGRDLRLFIFIMKISKVPSFFLYFASFSRRYSSSSVYWNTPTFAIGLFRFGGIAAIFNPLGIGHELSEFALTPSF